jgi:hypothetical protein
MEKQTENFFASLISTRLANWLDWSKTNINLKSVKYIWGNKSHQI